MRKKDLEERYPGNDFRYVRNRTMQRFFNPAKKTWHENREEAMMLSPAAINAVRNGVRTYLSRYPLSDLEFVE